MPPPNTPANEAPKRASESTPACNADLGALAAMVAEGREASRRLCCELTAPLAQLAALWTAMNEASPFVMATTLWELGWFRHSDELITVDAVAAATCSTAKYRPLMAQWLASLEQVGILRRVPGSPERFISCRVDVAALRDRVDRAVAAVDISTDYSGFIDYFKTCVAHQTELLTGSANAHKLLFPAGTSRLVDGLYRFNPASTTQNGIVAAIVASARHRFGDGLRILEVGAGTGATTSAILADVTSFNFEYRYTDVSRFFLRRAARQFGDGLPGLTYGTLDIDQPPEAQGFQRNSFDIIIAVNAVHAAKHIGRALNHLNRLMSDGGVMIANETTTNTSLQMITFGHFEGVCHFEDDRRQSNLPFLSCSQWQAALRSAGFGPIEAIEGPYSGAGTWEQHVLLAARAGGANA